MENTFKYMKNKPQELDTILKMIEKLNIAKLNYSIQELQALNILVDEKRDENKRILVEARDYLNICDELLNARKYSSSKLRRLYNNSLEKREVDENINIDLSDLKSKIYTLADLSFKANKLTKWVCKRAEDIIIGENKENDSLKKVIKRLKLIYRSSNSESTKRLPVEDELYKLSKEVNSNDYKGWNDNIEAGISNENVIKAMYNDLCQIWNVENVLYEIKSQLNTELLKCLIQDNYNEFKNWGFHKDEKGMFVLVLDHKEIAERYGYHIPDLNRVLSDDLIEQIKKQNLQFEFSFTNSVRKNSLDRIKEKIDGKSFLQGYKTKLIDLLKEVNFDNYTENEYGLMLELYTLGKFLSVGTYKRIAQEYPDLEKKCQQLKELVSPSKDSKQDLSNINVKEYQTKYERDIKEQIEERLEKTRKIYIQYGSNLDINASIYALRKHMRDEFGISDIQIVKIDAGEQINDKGLLIDAGTLEGIEGFSKNYKGRKSINANVLKAQKSACGVLSQYGFDIPSKIVQYADTVISDERILMPRYGLNIIRYLTGKKLFDFANAKREDGTYLIETELTDDELKQYSTISSKSNTNVDLLSLCKKREEQIKNDIKEIKDNIHIIHSENGDKYVAVIDHMINCGAMISYSLGCDYYVSIASKQEDFATSSLDLYETDKNVPKATFTVNANPKKGDGKLPKELLDYCEQLRDEGENDVLKMVTVNGKNDEKPFIKPTGDMVVFGGPKTPHLFVTLKEALDDDIDIKEEIMYELTDRLEAKVMKKDEREDVIKKSIEQWKSINAQTLSKMILSDTVLTLNDVESQGRMINSIIKEKEREENDITSN